MVSFNLISPPSVEPCVSRRLAAAYDACAAAPLFQTAAAFNSSGGDVAWQAGVHAWWLRYLQVSLKNTSSLHCSPSHSQAMAIVIQL